MTVSEMLKTLQGDDVFGMFPGFSNAVHILAAIPATSCSAERSYSALHRLKTYPLISMRRYLPPHNNELMCVIDSLERIFSPYM